MNNTKLTLRMDQDLIKIVKKIASSKGISLSKMVSNYFKTIASEQKKEVFKSPVLLEISGILKKTDQNELKQNYNNHIKEKYS